MAFVESSSSSACHASQHVPLGTFGGRLARRRWTHRALLDNPAFCAARHRLDFVERHCDPDGRLVAEVAA
jgi:hypothetical protein